MFTILPHPRSFMWGQTACAQLNAPVRLTRRSRSHSSGDWSGSWPRWSSVPALLTWMSAIATSAPARASVSASARPSPRDPPVTSATRPERSISIATRQEYFAGDHEPLDLRGPLVDLEQLRVPHQLLDRVLLHVAVAAEDLDGVGRDLHRRVGGEPLCERRLERRAIALGKQSAGLPGEQPWRLDLGRHVGDQEVDSLVDGDRLTEQ